MVSSLSTSNRVLGTVSCVCIQLICSNFSAWNTINVYVYTYLRRDDVDLRFDSLNSIFFWTILSQSIGVQFGVQLAYRVGFRTTILVAGILSSLCTFAASFTTTYIMFTLTFAVASQFFSGLTFLISFDRIFKIFPKHQAIACGLINVSYGIGILAAGELCYILINPNNVSLVKDKDYYPQQIADNLPFALRVISIYLAGFSFLAVLTYSPTTFTEVLTSSSRQRWSIIEDTEDVPSSTTSELVSIESDDKFPSLKAAIFSTAFAKIFFVLFAISAFGIYLSGNYKPYGLRTINDDGFMTLVGTVSGMLCGMSGLMWGALLSSFSVKKVSLGILVILTACTLIYSACNSTKSLFFLLTALVNVCFGGFYCLLPIISVQVFGQKRGSAMIGFFYQSVTLATFFAVILAYLIADYNIIFYIYSAVALTAIPVIFTYHIQQKKLQVSQQNH